MKKIQNVYLTDDLLARIRAWVEKQPCNISISEIVRKALDVWLSEREEEGEKK